MSHLVKSLTRTSRLAGLLAASFILSLANSPGAARPNILFILCDDLGYGDVGVFFQNQRAAKKDPAIPFFTTPQIDMLAGDGMMLNQHYCGAPVCAPSRASLLTGLTQGHANIRDNQFDYALADTHTLGTVLQQAGYATAAIGKWGLQGGGEKAEKDKGGKKKQAKRKAAEPGTTPLPNWPAFPTRRGFDDYYGYVRHIDGHFHYPKEDGREVWENEREVSADLDLCFTTDLFTARAKKWITGHAHENPEQPFFLFLSYDTPHAKLQNPPCAYPAGGGLNGGLQWTGKPHAMINTATGKMDGWMHPDYANATWDHDGKPATREIPWPESQKRHANNVRRIDDAVGDLLKLLADLKIADHTLVVFTSDNGPSMESYLANNPYDPNFFHGFGPFDGIKRDTLEGGMREPTIARWPDHIPRGSVNPNPSGHWDWLATFADLSGTAVPAASDGVSLLPELTGTGKRRPGILYSEYFNDSRTPKYPEFESAHQGRKRGQMQVVFVDGFKGLRYDIQSADQDFEIYNVAKDPKESNNLAKGPEYQKLQETMKARALQSRKPAAKAPRPYDKAPVPAIPVSPTAPAGVSWSSFPGEWPWMPDFRNLKPEQTGTRKTITLPDLTGERPFGISFDTFFKAPTDGEYTFTIDSDGGVMFFIHDIRLIDEGKSTAPGRKSGSVHLKAGWHPLRLLYRNISSAPKLILSVGQGSGSPLTLDETNLRQNPS